MATWPRQIIGATTLGVSVVVMGYGWPLLVVLGFPLVDVISPLWGAAGLLRLVPLVVWGLFSVAGVVFGALGVLAVCVSANINAMPILDDKLAALLSVSALLVALIPAWAFRYFKCDLRIRTSRDGAVFMLFGVILSNIASTFTAHILMYNYGLMGRIEALFVTLPQRFFLTSISTILFGFPLLWGFSRIVIKVKAYCRGWFS